MAIGTFSPTFKFASIRNPKPMESTPDIIPVMPDTNLILSIVSINESNSTNAQKLIDTNKLLQSYIDSDDFIKTTSAFYSVVDINKPTDKGLKLMYDNLIVRLLTKSNTNEVYGSLLKYIKIFAANINSTTANKIRIIIPEKITFPFTEFEGKNEYIPPTDESAEIIAAVVKLTEAKNKINEAKENNIIEVRPNNKVSKRNVPFFPLLQYFGKSEVIVSDAEIEINNKIETLTVRTENKHTFPQTDETLSGNTSLRTTEDNNEVKVFNEIEHIEQLKKLLQLAIDQNITELNENEIVTDANYNVILSVLEVARTTIEAAEKKINEKLKELYKKTNKLVPGRTYSLIGKEWIDITPIFNPNYVVQDETSTSIMVHTHGCYLKYPVQVADLRVIEQQAVGYLPAEIAHINNTQRGEKNTRVTRRLKKVESFESIITDEETTRETDTQSAEKFSIETEAFNVQQEENSANVNVSVSGSYGSVSTTVNGGYSSSSLELSGNNSSQQYAKEIFTRVLDRVSNRTRIERSVLTIEEFEETVTHEIDNSTQETKSYTYRWLNKLVRGTLKNYGKRLIFEIQVAHPSSYFISRMIKEKPQLNIPDDPRELIIGDINLILK